MIMLANGILFCVILEMLKLLILLHCSNLNSALCIILCVCIVFDVMLL